MTESAAIVLTYATRRSALALAQSRAFAARLVAVGAAGGLPLELRELQVVTSGDRIQDRPLSEVGGKGLFVKEIEEALLDGRADFAVHSMKDLPAELPKGLTIGCVPEREDARDVLVAPRHGTLDALPSGARVGTSSLRRQAALVRYRPDLRVEPLRGNVDTRLRKADAGEYDAVILARAGLERLGLGHRATDVLPSSIALPAPAQGALAIECREGALRPRHDSPSIADLLAPLHDAIAAVCVAAERGVLEAVGGDCRTPLGAHAERVGETLRVRAFIARPDASDWRSVDRTFPWTSHASEARLRGIEAGRILV